MSKLDPDSPESRALRRHHRERLKALRRFYQTQSQGRDPVAAPDKAPAAAGKTLGMALRTPAPCSCALCGNPRRYFKEATLQERRSDEALRRDAES
ncbi:MAG: hypothetical protein AB7L76_16040 [Burkholderiaceae bacterium]